MDQVLNNTEIRMKKVIAALKDEYSQINAGRITPKILDKISVDYYGSSTKITQLAAVSVVQSNILQIQPFDPSSCSDIEKALQLSDLGVNPQNDGKVIRIIFPSPTEERRNLMAKEVAKQGENAKVAIRNIRRDSIDKLKKLNKNNVITQDVLASFSDEIQNLTDKYVKNVDLLSDDKRNEVIKV
ncbi:MAG: ribosome recycling factor [Oscillospiraceae bacterium]|jgi:ribosome recycling factor|nr:ribosome recycling factor [Oscillospiraceae bacterium]